MLGMRFGVPNMIEKWIDDHVKVVDIQDDGPFGVSCITVEVGKAEFDILEKQLKKLGYDLTGQDVARIRILRP